MNDRIVIVHKTAEDLLKRLQVDGLVEIEQQDELLVVNVNTGEAALLIGTRGETLGAFQHLLRSLIQRELGEYVSLVVDVEGYRGRRNQSLEILAVNVAGRVRQTGRPEALSPMSAEERRVVHMKIKELEGVVSESMGEGSERKIVVKPIMRDVR